MCFIKNHTNVSSTLYTLGVRGNIFTTALQSPRHFVAISFEDSSAREARVLQVAYFRDAFFVARAPRG